VRDNSQLENDGLSSCFVISPVGPEGSQIRRLADDLLDYVFAPAAEACGFAVLRADRLPTPGQVTPQLIDHLTRADVVIADLSGHNPNVMYELAVRHATGKPVIQLMAGDDPLPFDIKDYRTIPFQLNNGALELRTADQLKADIEAQLREVREGRAEAANPVAAAVQMQTDADTVPPETTRIFLAPQGHRYNSEFYEYFTAAIRNATDAIYITGDGFTAADAEGERIARAFHDAFRAALSGGVNVVRIQTKDRASALWERLLGELEEDFPDTFQLVTLAHHRSSQMSSVCVIDPEDAEGCVVEIMIQTEKLFGIKSADLAGTAMFVVARQDLALDMRARIVALCRTEPTRLYFAYGSNMDEDQMHERCPSAEKVGVAVLRDHRLVFNRRGSYRDGGVASVVPESGQRVYGVVWRIGAAEFERLDETEDATAYRRRIVATYGLDGSVWRTQLYQAIPEGEFPPDDAYVELLITAAEKAGLPPEYVAGLGRFTQPQRTD